MFSYNKYSVVLMGVVMTVLAQHVKNPFYFQNHKQRCNCQPNEQCSGDGTCTSDTCAHPYVGNTCQHAKISLSLKNTTTIPPMLLDGDDSTCLTTNNPSVIYQTVQRIHFIWIYLYRKSTQPMTPILELYMQRNKLDVSTYSLVIDEHSMLIKVKENVMYDTLKLFNLPEDLCSLEVSLGRNLAISSIPDISSIHKNDSDSNKTKHSLLAVDGDDTRVYRYGQLFYCVHTKENKHNETHWWKTHLKYDARVNWIKIVNRITSMCRLKDFELTLSNTNGDKVHTYKDDSRLSNVAIYSFPVDVNDTIREVKLSNRYNGTYNHCNEHGLINICEVYIYGEFQCPDKMYGAQCERECPGCSRELCDPDWGCPRGCLEGWAGHWCSENCRFRYGPECQHECSTGCGGHGICDITTGICLDGCRKGFFTPRCSQPCLPETYGENCSHVCSGCKLNVSSGFRSCDRETGECDLGCDEGREGDKCEGIVIQDPLYKTVRKVLLKVVFGVFCLLLIYKSCMILDDVSLTEESADENDGSKIADEKDDTETVQPESLEQSELVEIDEPNPITRALSELREMVENEPISRALTDLGETAENESIEKDRHSSSRSQGTSSATSKSSVTDSTSTATPGSERGSRRKNSLFAKFHALIAHQKENTATENRP